MQDFCTCTFLTFLLLTLLQLLNEELWVTATNCATILPASGAGWLPTTIRNSDFTDLISMCLNANKNASVSMLLRRSRWMHHECTWKWNPSLFIMANLNNEGPKAINSCRKKGSWYSHRLVEGTFIWGYLRNPHTSKNGARSTLGFLPLLFRRTLYTYRTQTVSR